MKLTKRHPSPSPRLLRGSRLRVENQENDDEDNNSSDEKEDDDSSEDSSASIDSAFEKSKQEMVSRRKTRSSKDSVLTNLNQNREKDSVSVRSASIPVSISPPATPSDRNGSVKTSEVETRDSDWCPLNGVLPDGVIRRSTRMRNARFDTLNQSWILGGGSRALGYPTRFKRRASNELAKLGKIEDSNEVTPPQPSDDEEVNDEVDESSDDLYGRVKNPLRRRSSRRTVNYRETGNSAEIEADHAEPVSRRLRVRTHTRKLANSHDEHKTRNEITKRHSRLGRTRRRRRRMIDSNSSSSSSDSEDYCRPQKPRRHELHKEKELNVSRKTFMGDIQPLAMDSSITFASVGGLDSYVNKMKEIVIFPLVYKEFFTSRNIAPPRGILFHGPPGTGKTLLARALANECSVVGGKKVSFFMRKGADILNKWIGESERQLKLLFEQASINQPSIIFFDELDGLAPVRSAKTDQVHNSIVSTLLAELDGVKDRGDIIVIGATNRVDSIDPALRRPGRFDHEFPFFLPSHEARRSILNVHLKDWKDSPVAEYFVDQLADMTVGYSGADLRLLCSEANMCALRRRYPQIYTSKEKLVLNYSSVQVERRDWETAMTIISRSSDRSIFSSSSTGLPLPHALRPLLSRSVTLILEKLHKIFPYRSVILKEPSRKRLLVYSESIELSEHILPAALHSMDSIPVYTLSIQTLVMEESEGKSVALLFGEATKRSTVSIIYIPNIDKVYQVLSESGQQILLSELSKTAFKPVLILASTEEVLPEELAMHFGEVSIRLPKPTMKERRDFFKSIFEKDALQVKWNGGVDMAAEVLAIAPPETKTWTPAEIAILEKAENRTIIQLKIFLRDTIHKIARMKKFVEFTKPVNIEEVPDYLDIISHPMDLETMMCKVNQGVYLTKADFNKDIELIIFNALSYNPAKSETDMRIRHRAYELRDFVFIELEEMDSDFDEKCCNIQKAREERQNVGKAAGEPSQDLKTEIDNSQNSSQADDETKSETLNNSPSVRALKRRRLSSWSKGITPTPKKFIKKVQRIESSSELPLSRSGRRSKSKEVDQDISLVEKIHHMSKSPSPARGSSATNNSCIITDGKPDEFGFIKSNKSSLYTKDLIEMLDSLVEHTSNCTTRQLLEIRFQLLRSTDHHNESHDKKDLLLEIRRIIEKVQEKKSK